MATITDERLRELEKAEKKLTALENGGVDNWEWYDEALKPLREEAEREDRLADILDSLTELLSDGLHEPAGRGAGYGFSNNSLDRALEYLKTLKIDLSTPAGDVGS